MFQLVIHCYCSNWLHVHWGLSSRFDLQSVPIVDFPRWHLRRVRARDDKGRTILIANLVDEQYRRDYLFSQYHTVNSIDTLVILRSILYQESNWEKNRRITHHSGQKMIDLTQSLALLSHHIETLSNHWWNSRDHNNTMHHKWIYSGHMHMNLMIKQWIWTLIIIIVMTSVKKFTNIGCLFTSNDGQRNENRKD